MRIVVNGAPHDVQAHTLALVLVELGYGEQRVATALDGNFVPAPQRADRALQPHCQVEIVSPRPGG
ncbi:sulfur carrier protein ThiS [Lichenicoccus sp.]|uniref:sulfur carrier protein ThiS n=1 Tax=Lichenicoccus sp. TaxID=2781899 RepID=UPI003D0F05E7